MHEHEKAKAWRTAHGLTVPALSALIGYSPEAIWAMERGQATGPDKGPIAPEAWRRYKCCCAAVDAHIKHQHSFEW